MQRRALSAAVAAAGFGWRGTGAQAATPQSVAVDHARDFVAGRPAALHASASDAFTRQGGIKSKEGLHRVPDERTDKGLPVVGGDFVVVTQPDGTVASTSVAQRKKIAVA